MTRASSTLGIVILGSLLTCSCDKIPGLAKTPSAVLQSMYAACNAGRYSEIDGILTADLLAMTKGTMVQMAGGIKGICDIMTRNGTLDKVEVLNEETRGEGATVTANLHFKDGTVQRNEVTQLVREEAVWRVSR